MHLNHHSPKMFGAVYTCAYRPLDTRSPKNRQRYSPNFLIIRGEVVGNHGFWEANQPAVANIAFPLAGSSGPLFSGSNPHWARTASMAHTAKMAMQMDVPTSRLRATSSARRVPELHRLPIPVLQAHSRRDPGFCSAMPTWEWPASGMPAQLNPVAVGRLGRSRSTRFRQVRAVKVRGERNYQDRFKRPRQRVTLPDHDRPTARLFPRAI